ncbi:lysozyme [Altererythrobacter sp. SALINAS58]|uniref:glycoside hydrolase family 25 protein n=1 Tax=Alteripontixanthobacter muriae TaxID=2705546 RepID=UPI0015756BC0|nr:glycoside hydrolase family 25 protein [Alteripontixanthobacter muriae]NTZ43118.1 lysozyme [Alteripontixanthobacter muriae]
MARRKAQGRGWKLRIALLLVVLAAASAAWLWWDLRHWTPDPAAYPDQGVEIGSEDGAINFRTLRALGAGFAYLDASSGAAGQDPSFVRNLADARDAGLMAGAVHRYDPCVMADAQTANFVTMTPREDTLLPPVIHLAETAENCPERVSEAAVESELTTLINQIETHTGKPVLLKVDEAFEDEYGLAARFERNLWLTRTRLQPEYAGRPWLLWTANEYFRSPAADAPLRWVVAQN